jgi:hypothetical protein
MEPTDDEFRAALGDVLARTRLSRRGLSAALGRDPGYVAALLDPSRPSRARPTPADLLRLSDATGLSLAGLLESLWGMPQGRLQDRLDDGDSTGADGGGLAQLAAPERAVVRDFIAFMAARRAGLSRLRS